MKPLQFSQEKYNNARLSKKANKSVTEMDYNLRQIQSNHPLTGRSLNGKKTRLAIATYLFQYYSILFNPQYRKYFRPLTDLTLLFPTSETINILPSTNFILVPLPLPTYEERTDRGRFHNNCPFLKLKPNNDTNEFVRDLDYLVDSETYINEEHIIRKKYRHIYHHTPRATKKLWTHNELDGEARLFVYKYQDVPTYIAKKNFPNYPIYDIGEALIPHGSFTPVFKKFTLLNIPKRSTFETKISTYKLNDYSKQKLIPGQLDEKFADFFDFTQVSSEAIINYFLKNLSTLNEYSIPQIKSGIKRLNDIVKYARVIKREDTSSPATSTLTTLPPNDTKYDIMPERKQGRPKSASARVRFGKIYNPDGTVSEFKDVDEKEYARYTLYQLKDLYSNDNNNDTK